MNVTPNEATPFEVTLPAPASADGVTVTLKSSDTSKVIVTPASVVIPQGATTPATQPQVRGVGIGAATITAAATGYTPGAGVVTVTAPTLAFTGSPLLIGVGGVGNLTLIRIGGQDLAVDLTVNLSASDTSKVKVSATVSFAPGITSVTVPVLGLGSGSVTITASAPGIASVTAAVTVTLPPTVTASYGANSLQVINVGLVNTSAVTAVNLRITSVTNVTAAVPNVIALRPNVIIPMPYGTLEGGQGVSRNFTFEATAGSISVPFTFIVTIEADNMPPETALIKVPFPRSMAFSGSPLAINAGVTGELTLNLLGNEAPAAGLIVNLSSSDPSRANVPATVSFAPGAISVTVPVTGIAAGSAVITATATVVNFPAIATAAVNVTSAIGTPTVTSAYGANFLQLINVVLTNTSGLTAVNLRITSVTNLTTAPPGVIALLPNNVIPMPYGNLAGGQTQVRSFSFTATAGSIEVPFSFMITYEADNMPPQTAVIDVPFPRSMSFSGSPLAINVGAPGHLTLNLLGNQAPAAGLIVNLSSSDPSRAHVPATVSFAPGATSVSVPVAGLAPGSVTITATATVVNFPATATAIVNVGGGP